MSGEPPVTAHVPRLNEPGLLIQSEWPHRVHRLSRLPQLYYETLHLDLLRSWSSPIGPGLVIGVVDLGAYACFQLAAYVADSSSNTTFTRHFATDFFSHRFADRESPEIALFYRYCVEADWMRIQGELLANTTKRDLAISETPPPPDLAL